MQGDEITEGTKEFSEAELSVTVNDHPKPEPVLAPLNGNGHRKPVNKFDFLRKAQTYVPKVKDVELPDPFLGEIMTVAELRAGERTKYEKEMVRGRIGNQTLNWDNMRVGLIILSAVERDEHGVLVLDDKGELKRMFTESDRPYLNKMGNSVIQVIYNAAAELNALSAKDEEELMGES
jgi:hypothetical protein